MKGKGTLTLVTIVALVGALGTTAIAAPDKYLVKVPNGLAFSEFRGFEDWKVISVSHQDSLKLIEVIVGNQAMIDAYLAGVPGNAKPFPDGARMAKIHWNVVRSADEPGSPFVPGTLHDIDFMVRESKRFADSGNWGYAEFDYDAASGTFKPFETGTKCGYACHTIAKAKDYVFTAYGKR